MQQRLNFNRYEVLSQEEEDALENAVRLKVPSFQICIYSLKFTRPQLVTSSEPYDYSTSGVLDCR